MTGSRRYRAGVRRATAAGAVTAAALALVALVASCGRGDSPGSSGPPPIPNVPPGDSATEASDVAAGPTLDPCGRDGPLPEDVTPRETWAPIDCICLQDRIHLDRYENPTPLPTLPGGVLEVSFPRPGDQVSSPVAVQGVILSDDPWLKIDMGGGGFGVFKIDQLGSNATPFDVSVEFNHADRPGVACLSVYQTGGEYQYWMAGALRIPVYPAPPE